MILNVLDYRMTLADAMSAPRLHHQALPDSLRVERDGAHARGERLAPGDGLSTYVGGARRAA